MKIAVEGCCHGELDRIYETLEYLQKSTGSKVDLLLICGDFQAVRNRSDLQAMAVPQKYQKMNTFYKYYSGEKKAPILTVFIGGNHEASNYLQELPYGGWVAPNIYYLGYAGVVSFGGVRIAGLSGIYKKHDYHRGHYECCPYTPQTVRSVYHVRNVEVFRLKQISRPVDIVLSHDWPRGIYDHGDKVGLVRRKRFLADEIEQGILGNPGCEQLLDHLRPAYWFSAHMHVKFAALVKHQTSDGSERNTKFLSLDKCLPRRDFLQVIDVGGEVDDPQLEVDLEWLCILRATNHLFSCAYHNSYLPGADSSETHDFRVCDEDIASLSADFGGVLKIPRNFEPVAPIHDPLTPIRKVTPPVMYSNPQTTLICQMLELTNPSEVFSGRSEQLPTVDMDYSIDDEDSLYDSTMESSINTTLETTPNPDAIALNMSDDEDTDSGKVSGGGASSSALEGLSSQGSLASAPSSSKSSPSSELTGQSPEYSLEKSPEKSPEKSSENSPEKSLEKSPEKSLLEKFPELQDGTILQSVQKSVADEMSDASTEHSPIRGSYNSGTVTASGGAAATCDEQCVSVKRPSPHVETEEFKVGTPNSIKKFKRRNQAIYSSTDDDDVS